MSSYGTRSQMRPTVIGQAESVVERVYQAVEHLCTAPGDVRARLRGAVMTLLPLQVREFPEHLQGDFEWIRSQSTKYESEWASRRDPRCHDAKNQKLDRGEDRQAHL